MLNVTGQYVFAVILSLSQFIQPYSSDEVAGFSKGKSLPQWKTEAYRFTPANSHEMNALLSDDVKAAQYLRSACIRIISATQTERSIKKGKLIKMDFDLAFSTAIQDDYLQKLQNRILGEEQNISLVDSKQYLMMACDVTVPLEKLIQAKPSEAVAYYIKTASELAPIDNINQLPELAEVSYVRDQKGTLIGELIQTEVNDEDQVIRRNRRLLPKKTIPVFLKKALVSIEDAKFWNFEAAGSESYRGHNGVDFKAMMRAANSTGSGGNVQGASTITMQLAKNLLLYRDVFNEHYNGKRSLLRKLKEYILVARLEKTLSKDQILDWYLNTINYGRNSQGIVMAAKSYFDKALSELSIEESAFLMGLPKAPNALNPTNNLKAATKRRNLVLLRSYKEEHLSNAEYKAARANKLVAVSESKASDKDGYALHYLNATQKELKEWRKKHRTKKGESFNITIPINHKMQRWAVETLQRGLLKYERSTRSLVVKPQEDQLPNIKASVEELAASQNISTTEAFPDVLAQVKNGYPDGQQFEIGVILENGKIGLKDGRQVKRQSGDKRGQLLKLVNKKKKNLEAWDTVLLQEINKEKGVYRIASFTKVTGGIAVVDNKTGAVLATAGGFSVGVGGRYLGESGNSAFSSMRQPGSTVKPFSYLYALNQGVSPTEILLNQDTLMPEKYFNGEKVCDRWDLSSAGEEEQLTLRQGLEKSRNRLTLNTFIRASWVDNTYFLEGQADQLGKSIDYVLADMKKFGLYKDLETACYPILIGAEESSVKDIAGAYAALANGGTYNSPYVISQLERQNEVFKFNDETSEINRAVQQAVNENDPAFIKRHFNIFRIRTMLQGVVKRGTARKLTRWSEIIAGKTGTTNDNKDAWFAGFNNEITVVVWVGHANNKSLGRGQEGSKVALPIFEDFMEQYYAENPEALEDKFSMEPPAGGVTGRIEPNTGFLVTSYFLEEFNYYTGRKSFPVITEYFSNDELYKDFNYRPGSRIVGQFFFKYLSNQRRQEFENSYSQVSNSKIYDKHLKYCEYWKARGYTERRYKEVRVACRYVRENIRLPEVSPVDAYLQQLGFY